MFELFLDTYKYAYTFKVKIKLSSNAKISETKANWTLIFGFCNTVNLNGKKCIEFDHFNEN